MRFLRPYGRKLTKLGLSDFVVNLTIRNSRAEDYRLAVPIGCASDDRCKEILTTRTTLLEVFGQQVITWQLKDWWATPDALLGRIYTALKAQSNIPTDASWTRCKP